MRTKNKKGELTVFKRSDIVAALSVKTGFSKKDLMTVMDALVDVIRETLVSGKYEIMIRGFGSIRPRQLNSRASINPRTGERITTGPKISIRFKAARTLIGSLNGDYNEQTKEKK